MSDRFCTHCGTKIENNANYCSKCGARTTNIKRNRKTKDTSLLTIVICFIVIALICGTIIGVLVFKEHEITINKQYPQTMKEALSPGFTIEPTEEPTVEPTIEPTEEPTPSPTPKPVKPTPSPTISPGATKTYKNSRYGFSFKYPSDSFPSTDSSQNGSSIKLMGEDITVSVYGSNNVFHESLDNLYQDALNSHPDIDYHVKKSDNYVVSGTDGENMYYIREYVGFGSITTMSIVYPARLEKKFDAVVTLLSNSLKPGNLSEAH